MSVANQSKIIINRKKVSKKTGYKTVCLKSEGQAARALDAAAFKLWCYLARNADGFTLELSQVAVDQEFGIKKDVYYRVVKVLKDKGYLVPVREGSNVYNFIEEPVVKADDF